MLFVKSFKGYEDKTLQLDADVNQWVLRNKVDVVTIKTAMSHESNSRAGSGDIVYTIVYRADAPMT